MPRELTWAPELGLTQLDGAESCFEERIAAGQTAELIVVQHTIEGDPIVSIFRVLDDGSAEVFDDTTRDTFGSQAWFRYTCASYTLDPFGPETCFDPERITEQRRPSDQSVLPNNTRSRYRRAYVSTRGPMW